MHDEKWQKEKQKQEPLRKLAPESIGKNQTKLHNLFSTAARLHVNIITVIIYKAKHTTTMHFRSLSKNKSPKQISI
jgi:hypothetical protein